MPDTAQSMKSMKLYDQVERIHNELRALGIADDAPLTAADLEPFDSYHYLGAEAVESAATALRLTRDSRLLDVGSGIGGSARHLAAKIGCHVTALELQTDLDALSAELNARCGLAGRIETVCGDILDGPPDGRAFDALMSLLVFIHIGDRQRLLAQCHAALKPGGRIYIEDFHLLRAPDADQQCDLSVKVRCGGPIPAAATYKAQMAEAGFADIVFEDMTGRWSDFCRERLRAFRANHAGNVEKHGQAVTDGLEDFFRVIVGLFEDGVLGGLRISARRP
ncbi:MAG: methyltransferase domain-containing protein [Proteobacteria bacterium]|nr:methyltransferase domain-containing protein [Pseudomonadota bacterium]